MPVAYPNNVGLGAFSLQQQLHQLQLQQQRQKLQLQQHPKARRQKCPTKTVDAANGVASGRQEPIAWSDSAGGDSCRAYAGFAGKPIIARRSTPHPQEPPKKDLGSVLIISSFGMPVATAPPPPTVVAKPAPEPPPQPFARKRRVPPPPAPVIQPPEQRQAITRPTSARSRRVSNDIQVTPPPVRRPGVCWIHLPPALHVLSFSTLHDLVQFMEVCRCAHRLVHFKPLVELQLSRLRNEFEGLTEDLGVDWDLQYASFTQTGKPWKATFGAFPSTHLATLLTALQGLVDSSRHISSACPVEEKEENGDGAKTARETKSLTTVADAPLTARNHRSRRCASSASAGTSSNDGGGVPIRPTSLLDTELAAEFGATVTLSSLICHYRASHLLVRTLRQGGFVTALHPRVESCSETSHNALRQALEASGARTSTELKCCPFESYKVLASIVCQVDEQTALRKGKHRQFGVPEICNFPFDKEDFDFVLEKRVDEVEADPVFKPRDPLCMACCYFVVNVCKTIYAMSAEWHLNLRQCIWIVRAEKEVGKWIPSET